MQQVYDDVINHPESGFNTSNRAFLGKMLQRSGLGDDTAAPINFLERDFSHEASSREMAIYLEGCMDGLFARSGLKPEDIDFLVVNCSCHCPTPSMTAWIVNHYKMPSKVRTFQIGGMGCSASMVGVDMIRDLIAANPGKKAVLVSTEILTSSWYQGHDNSYALQTALFRTGGAAILFTGKKNSTTRYAVHDTVRTHHGAKDDAYNCILLREDAEGHRGVRLTKEIPSVAGRAIEENMTRIGEQILPLREKLKFVWHNMIVRKMINRKHPKYTPNFRAGVDNFCIHTGGRGVIDTVEKNLSLSQTDVEASRATLYQYGNTSSSSVWYELAYMESHGQMKPGNTVWQLAFGSGFMCNSAVMTALRGCRKNPVDFNIHNPKWRYDPETCKAPVVNLGAEVEAEVAAHRKKMAAMKA